MLMCSHYKKKRTLKQCPYTLWFDDHACHFKAHFKERTTLLVQSYNTSSKLCALIRCHVTRLSSEPIKAKSKDAFGITAKTASSPSSLSFTVCGFIAGFSQPWLVDRVSITLVGFSITFFFNSFWATVFTSRVFLKVRLSHIYSASQFRRRNVF